MKSFHKSVVIFTFAAISLFSAQTSLFSERNTDEELTQPRIVAGNLPQYTQEAREDGIQGKVTLEVLISSKGKVIGAEVIVGLHPALDEAAVAAVREWTFKPATLNGKPTVTTARLSIEFRLTSPESGFPGVILANR